MAGGGREFSYEDRDLDKKLDHDDNDEEEVNRTRPSQPGVPYHRGEQIEMQTMQHEQSGLPDTSYEETPLLSDFLDEDKRQAMIEAAKENIRDHFDPNVNFGELPPISFSKEGNDTEIVLLKGRGEE